jgi:segregation and condensation protein B
MKSALEVTQIGKKWTFQIRSEYTEKARYFAPPELPEDVVKTAALIAYHQPIRQSDLGDMIGEKVYDHVKMLRGLNLVSAKPEGRTLSLTTSRQFSDFFGLKATARKDIKRFMGEMAGMKKEETPATDTEAHD